MHIQYKLCTYIPSCKMCVGWSTSSTVITQHSGLKVEVYLKGILFPTPFSCLSPMSLVVGEIIKTCCYCEITPHATIYHPNVCIGQNSSKHMFKQNCKHPSVTIINNKTVELSRKPKNSFGSYVLYCASTYIQQLCYRLLAPRV